MRRPRFYLNMLLVCGVLGSTQALAVNPLLSASCRDFKFAKACGNFKCEPTEGETSENCPIDCSSSRVHSYNHQVQCESFVEFSIPETRAEAEKKVAAAAHEGRSVRVVGHLHSATSLICGRDIIVSTEKLNHIIGLRDRAGEKVVDVEPGVTLGELESWLDQRGYSLGYGVINYPHVTMAGAVSTASHGSSRKHPASVASALREIDLVSGVGEKKSLSRENASPSVWSAARVTLGSMGFISRLSFKVMPQFNLNVVTTVHSDSEMLKDYRTQWSAPCDHESYFWFPNEDKFFKICGNVTSSPADKEPRNGILLQGMGSEWVQDKMRTLIHYSRCDKGLACTLEKSVYAKFLAAPPFQKRSSLGVRVSSRNVTGPSHSMLTADWPDASRKFMSIIDWSLAIEPAQVTPVLNYIKAFVKSNKLCFPVGGVSLRFVKDDGATLAPYHYSKGSGDQAAVMLEFVIYDPQRITGALREKMDHDVNALVEDLVRLFKVRSHWGKNRDWVLEEAIKSGNFGDQLAEFAKVRNAFDPAKLFENNIVSRFSSK